MTTNHANELDIPLFHPEMSKTCHTYFKALIICPIQHPHKHSATKLNYINRQDILRLKIHSGPLITYTVYTFNAPSMSDHEYLFLVQGIPKSFLCKNGKKLSIRAIMISRLTPIQTCYMNPFGFVKIDIQNVYLFHQ